MCVRCEIYGDVFGRDRLSQARSTTSWNYNYAVLILDAGFVSTVLDTAA